MPKNRAKDDPLSRTNLKAVVWYTIAKIAEEAEMSGRLNVAVSEHFASALTEQLFVQAQSLASDLEHFASHANRTMVMADDVKIVTRRNEAVYEAICTEAVQRGIALKDLKTKAGAGSSKAVTTKLKPKPTKAAVANKGKPKSKAAASTSKAQGKGKEKWPPSDIDLDEDDDSDEPMLEKRDRDSDSESGSGSGSDSEPVQTRKKTPSTTKKRIPANKKE